MAAYLKATGIAFAEREGLDGWATTIFIGTGGRGADSGAGSVRARCGRLTPANRWSGDRLDRSRSLASWTRNATVLCFDGIRYEDCYER